MKILYLIIINVIFCISVFSQKKTETYDFVGALTTTGQGLISYKVDFEELENGKIQGVSVTDFYGENKTQSKVVGTINHKKQLISFREVNNIRTNSSEDAKSFCFINVNNLKLKTIKGKTIGNGDFIGKYSSGEECANGKIYLVSVNIIDDLNSMVDTLNLNTDTLKKIKSILNQAKSPAIENKIVKSNNILKYDWNSEHIIFDVWDGNKEDFDIINIYFNGKLIESNLLIENQKKTIDIPFKGDKGFIRIVALNEGTEPPNTVNFMLRNGNTKKSFLSTLKKGEEFSIEFNRNTGLNK